MKRMEGLLSVTNNDVEDSSSSEETVPTTVPKSSSSLLSSDSEFSLFCFLPHSHTLAHPYPCPPGRGRIRSSYASSIFCREPTATILYRPGFALWLCQRRANWCPCRTIFQPALRRALAAVRVIVSSIASAPLRPSLLACAHKGKRGMLVPRLLSRVTTTAQAKPWLLATLFGIKPFGEPAGDLG